MAFELPLKKYSNEALKSSVMSSSSTLTSMRTIGVGTSSRLTSLRISSITFTSLVLTTSMLFFLDMETNMFAAPAANWPRALS